MASAYTPGLQILEQTTVEKIRELPLLGKVLVTIGQKVSSSTPVLEAELPGEVEIIRLADRTGLDPDDVTRGLLVAVGNRIDVGQKLCEVKTFFGLFTTRYESTVDGTVEFYTAPNAHLGVRRKSESLTLSAYIDGEVSAIEEGKAVTVRSAASYIQGIFGIGAEQTGALLVLPCASDEIISESRLSGISQELGDMVLAGGAGYTLGALRFARARGVAGILTGSIEPQVLSQFLEKEISLSSTGDENLPLTLIVTEGFGTLPISERVLTLCHQAQGRRCSMNGATQVRAGAVRPELIICHEANKSESRPPTKMSTELAPGQRVRIIRVPYFGSFATVLSLPSQPEHIATGALLRVAHLRLDSNEEVTIPRANIEIV